MTEMTQQQQQQWFNVLHSFLTPINMFFLKCQLTYFRFSHFIYCYIKVIKKTLCLIFLFVVKIITNFSPHPLMTIAWHSFLNIAFVCYHCFMSVIGCCFSAYRNSCIEYRPIYFLMKFIYACSCMTDIERFTLIKHSSNSTFLNLIFQI